jgi:ribonuclease BN (tRNA processing enzyme)
MNAQWVILTHFSQRYPSIPKISEEARDKVGIAYDLMGIHNKTKKEKEKSKKRERKKVRHTATKKEGKFTNQVRSWTKKIIAK